MTLTIIALQSSTFHGSFGSKGSEAGQLNGPGGISVDSKDNVLVADRINNRIQIFDAGGHYLSSLLTLHQDSSYSSQSVCLLDQMTVYM